MLPRVAPLSRILLRNARPNVRTGYHEAGWRHPKEIAMTTRSTINDLPVPQGSWKEGFDKRNRTWNMYFASGLVTLCVTAYVVTIFIINATLNFLCNQSTTRSKFISVVTCRTLVLAVISMALPLPLLYLCTCGHASHPFLGISQISIMLLHLIFAVPHKGLLLPSWPTRLQETEAKRGTVAIDNKAD